MARLAVCLLLAVWPTTVANAASAPLIRSSEDTASRICFEYERPLIDLVLACQDAVDEFDHTDFEVSRIYDLLGDALDELDRPIEARIAFRKSIAAFSARDHPWRSLGWSFWNSSDYVEAAVAFRTALDLTTTAEGLAGLGSSLRRSDISDPEAAQLFERALLISPDYTWVMVEQGWMFFFKSQLQEAASTFRTALGIDPEYGSAAYGLSRALASSGDLDGALLAINDALAADDHDVVFVVQRAFILRRLGRNALALAESQRAIKLDPKEQDGFVEAARALRGLGRMLEGYAMLDKAIADNIGGNYLYFTYANMLVDEENWNSAIEKMDQAIEFEEADERDLNLRAFILLQLDRNSEALVAARTALKIAPDNSAALVNAAYAHLALGNTEDAVKALLAAKATGATPADLGEFIAFVLSQNRYLLAVRLRLEIGN